MAKSAALEKPTQSRRRRYANAIRALAMDAVQEANSGHPGAPLGMADMAEVLWRDYLRHSPANPAWPDRDRLVLSNGHASMLLYAALHLSGYDLSIDDLRQFRQLGSRTPGHPEFGDTPGVETTTGPLGQGLANAVGMAIAEQMLAAEFNKPELSIVDHYTYVFLGDGCLMEGISHEACSLAGTLGLGKLVCLYDDNGISIDGPVAPWFSENTAQRFAAYGWQVIDDVDGHDPGAIAQALDAARAETRRPSLICCKTVIGFGAPGKAGSEDCHGAPLGAEEIEGARAALGWAHPAFEIPEDVAAAWNSVEQGKTLERAWNEKLARYCERYPEEGAEFKRRVAGQPGPRVAGAFQGWIEKLRAERPAWATRKASGNTLAAISPAVPELVGGSADLTGSNNTRWPESADFGPSSQDGRYMRWGVREFGMFAGINGMTLHGGLRPQAGTFLVFSDYARNAIRMAALMKQPSIFVLSHDSVGLGEDGPTHQPVEHAASLRLIPNTEVWRPCDAVETAVAWQCALQEKQKPSCLLLSRQSVPAQEHGEDAYERISRGAYVLADAERLDCILMATGSEVAVAMAAREILAGEGYGVRVVSMPSTTRFDAQARDYRENILPPEVSCRIAIEAGVTDGWWKYAGSVGEVIGVDRFGASAPGGELFEFFGLTARNVAARAKDLLDRSAPQVG